METLGGFEIGKVHCIDCLTALKMLPDKSVDCVITDPQYGMNYHSNRYVNGNPFDKIIGDDKFPVEAIEQFERIAKRCVYVFCRWDNLQEIKKPKSFLCWVKDNWTAGDLYHEHGRQWEGIAFYPQEQHEFITRTPDIIFCPRVSGKSLVHPTQKPVELIGQIIRANVGDIICDPFSGSGTTGVACAQLGRRFLGFELSQEYTDLANDRIQAATRGQTLRQYKQGQEILQFGDND